MEEEELIEIPVYDYTEQDLVKKTKFNRAKEKKTAQQLIDEEMEWLYSENEEDYDK